MAYSPIFHPLKNRETFISLQYREEALGETPAQIFKTNFHTNGLSPGHAIKQRRKATCLLRHLSHDCIMSSILIKTRQLSAAFGLKIHLSLALCMLPALLYKERTSCKHEEQYNSAE